MTQLVIICAYLCLLLILGVSAGRLARGSSADFFLAERSIGPFLLLMSLFGTTMTAFALVGSSGEAYKDGIGVYGLMASISGIIHPAIFFLIGIKLWALGKRHGYMTQIQFFRDRLGSNGIGLVLFPILVGLLLPYLLIGVMAAGTIINVITEGALPERFKEYDGGIPPALGSALICVVVLFYVFTGGLRGTAWANAFQTVVFMIVAIVAFFVIAGKLGGLNAASEAVLERTPSRFKRTIDPADHAAYESRHAKWEESAIIEYLRTELKMPAGQRKAAYAAYTGPRTGAWKVKAEEALIRKLDLVATSRDLHKEKATAVYRERERDPNYEQKAYELFSTQLNHPDPGKRWSHRKAAGVYRARYWEPRKPHAIGMWQFFTYLFIPLSVGMFPHLFQHWLTARSARSFRLTVIAHPLCIIIVWVPCVLIGAWATSAVIADGPRAGAPLVPAFFNPNAVLPFMVKALTTPVVGGLLAAGILAAIMSSLDSQFLCLSNIFTNDIVLHHSRRTFSDRQVVIMGRVFVVLVVVVTYLLSLSEPRSVFTLGIWCFSGFGALFPVIVTAVYWRRLTKAGAYAGILCTAAAWLAMFWKSGFGSNRHYMITWLGDERAIMPVAVLFLICLFVTVGVSLITRPPDDARLRKFFPAA